MTARLRRSLSGSKTYRRESLEIAAVALTAAGKLLLADTLGWRVPFTLASLVLWAAYIGLRAARDPRELAAWGFTTQNLESSAGSLLPSAAAGALACVAYGLASGRLLLHRHILPLLALYPLWGLVQQFLLVGLFASGLRERLGLADAWAVLVTAVVFALVHLPSLPLAVATFAMAAATTSTYFRVRNLLTLGVFHGWLATLVYYFVLGEDVWKEFLSQGWGG